MKRKNVIFLFERLCGAARVAVAAYRSELRTHGMVADRADARAALYDAAIRARNHARSCWSAASPRDRLRMSTDAVKAVVAAAADLPHPDGRDSRGGAGSVAGSSADPESAAPGPVKSGLVWHSPDSATPTPEEGKSLLLAYPVDECDPVRIVIGSYSNGVWWRDQRPIGVVKPPERWAAFDVPDGAAADESGG